jgi:hypothetical protein
MFAQLRNFATMIEKLNEQLVGRRLSKDAILSTRQIYSEAAGIVSVRWGFWFLSKLS